MKKISNSVTPGSNRRREAGILQQEVVRRRLRKPKVNHIVELYDIMNAFPSPDQDEIVKEIRKRARDESDENIMIERVREAQQAAQERHVLQALVKATAEWETSRFAWMTTCGHLSRRACARSWSKSGPAPRYEPGSSAWGHI